jgi:hypothetical protein
MVGLISTAHPESQAPSVPLVPGPYSRAFRILTIQEREILLLTAVATLPAIAFLVIIHRAVLTCLAALRLVRRKRHGTNRRQQDGKQDLRVIFHRISLVRDVASR